MPLEWVGVVFLCCTVAALILVLREQKQEVDYLRAANEREALRLVRASALIREWNGRGLHSPDAVRDAFQDCADELDTALYGEEPYVH